MTIYQFARQFENLYHDRFFELTAAQPVIADSTRQRFWADKPHVNDTQERAYKARAKFYQPEPALPRNRTR